MNRRVAIFLIILIPVPVIVIGQACSDTRFKPVQIPAPTVQLKIQNYCPAQGYTYRDVFAFNSSAKIEGKNWSADSDRDGLTNSQEKNSAMMQQFGISYNSANTTNAAFSDLVMVKMGLDQNAQNLLPNCADPSLDSDGDGLNDCTEAYIHTDPKKADTDGDGIPDGIEFLFGLNPLDTNDAYQATMGDDIMNIDKIKAGIPIGTMADDDIRKLGLTYSVATQNQVNGSTSACQDITVSNIPIMGVTNGNKIWVYVVEDKVTNTSGTNVLDREVHWLAVLIPKEVSNHSTIVVKDGINQQTVDGTFIPLVVVP